MAETSGSPSLTVPRGSEGRSDALRALLEKKVRRRLAQSPRRVIPRREVQGPAALSFAQRRLWFLDSYLPGSAAYNIFRAFELAGPLDQNAFTSAYAELRRRQHSLRTIFEAPGEEPVQRVVAPDASGLGWVDLSGLPPGERQSEARRQTAAEARRPFDLSVGPLLRVTLLRLAADEHVLLLTLHHIISDGWSMGILFHELGEHYRAALGNRSPRLAPLPIQYTDYAAWEQSRFGDEASSELLSYWCRQLAGRPPVLELPTDRPRPAHQRFRGAGVDVALPKAAGVELERFGQQGRVTPFMVLLAAFASLLHRHSGQSDLVIGTPVAGRRNREVEDLIGFFVNSLALRLDTAGDPSFRSLVGRARTVTLEGHERQELPFDKLVEELQPERSTQQASIFQVMFSFQDGPVAGPRLPGITGSRIDVLRDESKFDLELDVTSSDGVLTAHFRYDRDLFDASTVGRLARHYRVLLTAGLADPDRPLGELSPLTAAERHEALIEQNDTVSNYGRERSLPELFAASVAAHPERIAAVYGGRRIRYRDLEANGNRLARRLRQLGTGRDALVGVCIPPDIEMIVALVAVLKAGGAYLTLDADYPVERLTFMLEDTGASVVLTTAALASRFAIPGVEVIAIDRDRETWEDLSDAPLEPAGGPDQLAYLTYTSGSTGVPKGVAVPQRAVARLLFETNYVELDSRDRFAQVANLSFDAATFEIWGALLHGGRVVGVPREVVLQPSVFERHLKRRRISQMFLTVTLFNQVVRQAPAAFENMKTVLFGGEACDPEAVRQAIENPGPRRLLNGYGPTECTTFAIWHRVDRLTPEAAIPIGRPLANTEAHVFDRALRMVPIAVLGELLLGGPGLARGYWNRPGLTASRFVPHPLAGQPGERLYRTGDVVRRNSLGEIEFFGRTDHQVKIRGFRIEPGEIEQVLAKHPSVSEATVVVSKVAAGDPRLVAYAVPLDASLVASLAGAAESGAEADERVEPDNPAAEWIADLRRHVTECLPAYMVPAYFVPLARLPLTASGKADRAALTQRPLPTAELGSSAAQQSSTLPRTPTEEMLAGLWIELLGVDLVGVDDSFFDLGGHSLLATRLTSRVRSTFGCELPVRRVFEQPRLSALAVDIERSMRAGEANVSETPISRAPRETPLPLSFGQERLWFLDQLLHDRAVYNIPTANRLLGPLEPAALDAAFSAMVARHEVLRTRFQVISGQPRQQIHGMAALTLPWVDLSSLPATDRLASARQLAAADAARAFDLGREPLWRATLLGLAEDDHVLLVTFHHAVADGWSLDVFDRELGELYRAAQRGGSATLAEMPFQYADYAVWQRDWLSGDELERQLGYWRDHLKGAEQVLDLPIAGPRPAVQTFRAKSRRRSLAPALGAALRAVGRQAGATFFMTLLAAFKVLLWRISGQADLVVGTPIANRRQLETEHLIGLFANFLGLRTQLRGDHSFRDLLERVRNVALGAYAHQDLPFERLVEELRPTRDLSRHPLVQVVFLLDSHRGGSEAGTLSVPGTRVEPFDSGYRTVKYDLALVVEEGDETLAARLEYNADLFEATAIERLLASFESLLRSAVEEPGTALADLAVLSKAVRHQLVCEWNATRGAYGETATLQSLCEDRAGRCADLPAVIFGDRTWTYRELSSRANRLAHFLRSSGVGRGDLVGVYLERAPEMLAAVLGVVKAGAAYVPLDSGWPEQRVRTILARMNIGWLITDSQGLPVVEQLAERSPLAGVVCLDREPETARTSFAGVRVASLAELAAQPDDDPAAVAGPDDLAYIIFTSGSTGEPKGVMVQHRAAVNLIEWVNRTFDVGPEDRLLFVTALTFDLSVYDVFGMLAAGGSVRIADRDELRDPERLARIVIEEPITFWDSAPAALQQLVSFLPIRPQLARDPALRLVFLSGDWIPVPLPDRLRETFPGVQVTSLGGATEATIWSNVYPIGEVDPSWPSIPYGRPITNARYHVLDPRLSPCPVGVPGDLYIADLCLSMGYARSPVLSASKYLPDPLGSSGSRLYRTGDRARYLADGNLQFLGRSDTQVKVRGYRIELGEIEAVLTEQPGVREAVVLVRQAGADRRLVAYFIPQQEPAPAVAELRAGLAKKLPEYMLPAAYVALESWPLAATGKLDRKALPDPETWRGPAPEAPSSPAAGSRGALEASLVDLWREVLGLEQVTVEDNFFDLGGHSLLLVQVHTRLPEVLGRKIPMTDLFRYPTIGSLAEFLWGEEDQPELAPAVGTSSAVVAEAGSEIAIIGMAGRFAAAGSVEDLWSKLCEGEEMIRFFTDEELRAAGFDEDQIADPRFVKARGALPDPELFDAEFFGISPREAQILDPQHRHFLEVAHQALEVAGYGAPAYRERVGVFAGASANTYQARLLASSDLARRVGPFELQISNQSDYLPTRVSYKLGLTGPSCNVQTACSTSLVAIHMACLGLLAGDCDLALAGGASVAYREVGGHLFEEGGVQSPDGHTRTFDAAAKGVTTGSGVGVVVLKRLADALQDGDTIDAVVLGTASNNDGALRAGFTAPSSEGQAEVIRDAQIKAGVDPETITYVEAHGTGTALGDPIEVAGLTQAFRTGTEKRGYCALGALKTNIGHLDAAAGVAGFIKTALALKHQQIPPSLNFHEPNPKIDFADSPFYVSSSLAAWPRNGVPRRAGVSSFGIGGTNAHAVLEEAPHVEASSASRPWQLLTISARTPQALAAASGRLAQHLGAHPELDLADVAFTLQQGRRAFRHRRVVVCRDLDEAAAALSDEGSQRTYAGVAAGGRQSLAFLFSGQGAQHPAMTLQTYRDEPVFRQHFDRCVAVLEREAGLDLWRLLDPEPASAAAELDRTDHAQPALFAVEISLARLLMHWGLRPEAMLGHSLGEYVAACLAGVFTVEEGLRLTAARGRLMQALPRGEMLAVALAADEAQKLAADLGCAELAVATISGPENCVLSGEGRSVARVAEALAERDVTHRRLHTSHAFHSSMMEPALAPLAAELEKIDLRPPQTPYVSNLTGDWIRDTEATDPAYWCEHLRRTVRLDEGFKALFDPAGRLILEVGPGRQLATAARQHPDRGDAGAILNTLPPPGGRQDEGETLLSAVGRLWVAGADIDWRAFAAGERRRRVPLPTYPFERRRFWIDRQPDRFGMLATTDSAPASETPSAIEAEQAAALPPDAAPRTAEQEAVAAAFSELLGVAAVGLFDDFFELGGSSLSALRLPSLLRQTLGVEIPSTALLEASTVASLAELVSDAQAGRAERPACLVRLQGQGEGRPLFMVHPVGGTVYWFRDLARGLTGRPFYALRSPGLAAGEETLGSVAEMATCYVEALRSVQPRGPYFLGGSSMGGSVAFEMARQLREAGDEIALLVLLDSPCLDQLPPRPDEAEILVSVFEGSCPVPLEALRRMPESERLEHVLRAAVVEPTADAQATSSPQAPAVDPAEIRRLYRVSSANVAALYAYQPRPLPCPALFFRAQERRPGDAPRPELPWIALAEAGIEIRPVAGDHVSMNYSPNAEAMAQHLTRRLDLEEGR